MVRARHICLIAVGLFFFLLFQGIAMAAELKDENSLMQGSSLRQEGDFLVVHLKGSPYQMGFQHGRLLRERIRAVYYDYLLGYLRETTKTQANFDRYFKFFKNQAKRFNHYIPSEYRQEMRGIADGSGMAYSEILIMNTFLDVVSYPKFNKRGFTDCTNFVVMDKASVDGGIIHARNLSWPAGKILNENTAVMFYQPQNGNSFAALSCPGICGLLTGINDKGVTIGEGSAPSAESSLEGMPAFLLLRGALQYSNTIYDAIRVIGSNRRTTGYNVTISDGKFDKACVMEFNARHYFVRFAKNGFVAACNNFQDAKMLETMKPLYPGQKLEEIGSCQRLQKVTALVQDNYGKVDVNKAEDFLRDNTLLTGNTFLSVVFTPKDLRFCAALSRGWIAAGKFKSFDLASELNLPLPKKDDFFDPETFYSYEKSDFQFSKTLIKETRHYKVWSVAFKSIVKTDFSDDTVYLAYYEPKGLKSFPAVLMMPHSSGRTDSIEGQFSESLVEDGVAVAVVNMPFQQDKSPGNTGWVYKVLAKEDLNETSTVFRQMVVEARRGIDWLCNQPQVQQNRIGFVGISLGAIIGPIIVATDTRISSAVYVLGGGDISSIIYYGNEVNFLKQALVKDSVRPVDFEMKLSIIDPLTFSFLAKNTPSIMYNSLFDKAIPRESALKLWRALNQQQIYWVPAAHYTAALFLGDAKYEIAKHFNKTLKEHEPSAGKGFGLSAAEDVELSHQGFFDNKTRITGSSKYSEAEKTLRLGLISEDIAATPFFAGLDVDGRWDHEKAYALDGRNMDIYSGLNVAKRSKLTVKYANQEVRMFKVSSYAPDVVQRTAGVSHVSDLSFSYERMDVDNRYYPTKGSAYNIEWDWASRSLGGDYNYNLFTWQTRGYHTFDGFLTLAARTKVGWMESYGKDADIPYYELFFNGGTSTIRGYRSRFLGPFDTVSDLPLGGDFIWINNLELRAPVYKKLAAAVFFDFGGLWEKAGDFSAGDLRSSSGLGLRYLTQWGVLRLDYGWRLHHESGQAPSEAHATFGIPF